MSTVFLLNVIIYYSLSAVYSKTSHCNYAIDTWWLTATPPSLSPTPSPTYSPTSSPTDSPTYTDETTSTLEAEDEAILDEAISKSYSFGVSAAYLLNPYPIDSCYSFNFTQEPLNAVSVKYSCKSGENTLIRKIYWDSLQCDGNDIDTTQITESEQGVSTTFICDASRNCSFATIEIKQALTMSPTPQPTDSPTPAPTNSPLAVNETQSPLDNVLIIEAAGGSDGKSSVCDNKLGPNPNSAKLYEWKYVQNICINAEDLSGLFVKTPSPTKAPSTSTTRTTSSSSSGGEGSVIFVERDEDSSDTNNLKSIGWFCKDNRYTLSVYNVSECRGDALEYIAYNNNQCVLDDAKWGYVECGEDIPTQEPTNAPTITPCDKDLDCEMNELCVIGTGECQSKIVDSGCKGDGECGDDYKCNIQDGLCYFSQCSDDNDCDKYESASISTFSCNTLSGINNGNSYSYGLCVENPKDTTGGVYTLSVFGTFLMFLAIFSFIQL